MTNFEEKPQKHVYQRPFSFWFDVIFKSKYFLISIVISFFGIRYLIDKGSFEINSGLEGFIGLAMMYATLCLLSSGAVSALSVLLLAKAPSLIALPIYIQIYIIKGWFNFFRDMIRLPINLVKWVLTKVSDKYYQKFIQTEVFID